MTSYAEADCIVLFDFETAFIRSLLTDLNKEFEGGTLHEWWFPEPSKLEYTNILALSHWVKDGLQEIDTPTYKLADFVDNGRTNSIHIMECIEHKPSIIRSNPSLKKYSQVIDRYLELRSDPQASADMYQELPLQVFAHQNGRRFCAERLNGLLQAETCQKMTNKDLNMNWMRPVFQSQEWSQRNSGLEVIESKCWR